MTTKGSGGEVATYYMSLHLGICLYGNNHLKCIYYGDRPIWTGNLNNTEGGKAAYIDKRQIFGGLEKEGGAEGKLWFLDGNDAQTLPSKLATKLERTPTTVTGYRGLASIWLTEPDNPSATNPESPADADTPWGVFDSNDNGRPSKGFYLGANNPYLKEIHAVVRGRPNSLGSANDMIQVQDTVIEPVREQWAANPAHVLYEALTNPRLGLGDDPDNYDTAQWQAQAAVLFNEGFGIIGEWNRTTPIEDFTSNILELIQGRIDLNPLTGLYELKLLRADYDPETLPSLNPSNARFSNKAEQMWGELANEIVVKWTDPETLEEKTVAAQDPASIAIQGSIISDTRNYPLIPSEELAMRVAERDVGLVSMPKITLDAEVSRKFWASLTGDVVVISWPKKGISSMICRIGRVRKSERGRITLSLYEDVFGMPRSTYLSTVETAWTSSSTTPSPLLYYKVGTLPAFLTITALALTDVSQLAYPMVLSAVIGAADTIDDIGYNLVGPKVDANGDTYTKDYGTQPLRTSWVLTAGMVPAAASNLEIPDDYIGGRPQTGDFVLIDNGADQSCEFATVTARTQNTLSLARGVMDTVPGDWPIGTRVFFIPKNTFSGDATKRIALTSTSYKMLTKTTLGTLTEADAPNLVINLSERPHLPLRPANVKVEEQAFGVVPITTGSSITVKWANRNRLTESAQVLKWDAASTTGEAGQTTTVYLLKKSDRSLLATFNGLTGTQTTIAAAAYGATTEFLVRVTSKRDGLESLQGFELEVSVT